MITEYEKSNCYRSLSASLWFRDSMAKPLNLAERLSTIWPKNRLRMPCREDNGFAISYIGEYCDQSGNVRPSIESVLVDDGIVSCAVGVLHEGFVDLSARIAGKSVTSA